MAVLFSWLRDIEIIQNSCVVVGQYSSGFSSEKSERNDGGGGGILTFFNNRKVYPTNFMPFLLTIFADFWDLGAGGRQFPPVSRWRRH